MGKVSSQFSLIDFGKEKGDKGTGEKPSTMPLPPHLDSAHLMRATHSREIFEAGRLTAAVHRIAACPVKGHVGHAIAMAGEGIIIYDGTRLAMGAFLLNTCALRAKVFSQEQKLFKEPCAPKSRVPTGS